MPKFLLVVGRVFRLNGYLALGPDRNRIGSNRRAFRHAATVSFAGRVRARPIIPLAGQRFDELNADFEPTRHFSALPVDQRAALAVLLPEPMRRRMQMMGARHCYNPSIAPLIRVAISGRGSHLQSITRRAD